MKVSRNKVQQIPVIFMLSMHASTYYSINIFYYTLLQLIKHAYVPRVGTSASTSDYTSRKVLNFTKPSYMLFH